MNTNQFKLWVRRRRVASLGLLVSGVAIASAFGSRDLDAFTEALQTVAGRYLDSALPAQVPPATNFASAITVPAAPHFVEALVPTSVVSNRIAMPVAPPSAAPLALTSAARSAGRSIALRPMPPQHLVAVGGSVAAEYHLPTPALVGRHDEPTFPSFRTTAVADDKGRAVELADAAPVRVLPAVEAGPAVKLAVAAPSAVLPTPDVATPVVGAKSIETISRGRGAIDAPPISAVGAALPDAVGWVPTAGVQSDGTPGGLAWETVVDNGSGMGIDTNGGRGATTPGWTPGTGEFHDVIVHPDGSLTVLPEPTALLGIALAGVLLRRRR